MSGDCVLDASALVLALVGKSAAADALRQRLPAMRRHAPHLTDAEVGNILRRNELSGRIDTDEARFALRAGHALIEHRYLHAGPLAELAWQHHRANLSFYDALYVAQAVLLGVPLLTADAKLGRAAGLGCDVEVV